MKNINRSLMIAAGIGIVTFSALAIDLVPTSRSLERKIEKKNMPKTEFTMDNSGFTSRIENYLKVDLTDIPQVAKSAVISKYTAYSSGRSFSPVKLFIDWC